MADGDRYFVKSGSRSLTQLEPYAERIDPLTALRERASHALVEQPRIKDVE